MNPKKILIVDDEEKILELLEKKLSIERFGVVTATRGQEAVEKATAYLPDLILMDIMLPDLDGAEAVRMLKDNASTANIPIIFLSGIAPKESDGKSWINVGGDRYQALAKPFSFEDLMQEVRNALR